MAKLLLDPAKYDRADDLISDILDIREEHQGENHPELAAVLLLWCRLLYAQANYTGMESVAARAERIFAAQMPPDWAGIAAALRSRGLALQHENQLGEAEPLMRRALEIDERSFGQDHPDVARDLNNLALLLQATNRLGEAEPLMRRMVLIVLRFTLATGHPHPHLRVMLKNYAILLQQWKGAKAMRDGILPLGPEAGMETGQFQQVLNQVFGG